MKFKPQTAIKTDLQTFTLWVSHFLLPLFSISTLIIVVYID